MTNPQGFNVHSDILTQTKDGRDLNGLWADYQTVLATWNGQRQTLVDFLTYTVTDIVEEVSVPGTGADFEEATEFGQPVGTRPNMAHYAMGFPFRWYDLAARFTWMFLADATAQQVDAIQNAALEADSRLVFNKVMKRLFDNTNSIAQINLNAFNVYTFYNGDGINPVPSYMTNTFASSHNHYVTTDHAVSGGGVYAFSATDLDDLLLLIQEHGFTKRLGYKLVVLANKQEITSIKQFRSATSDNPATATNNYGDWDFIPALGTNANPQLLTATTVLLGEQPNTNALGNDLEVVGSYGDALIVHNDYIPAGYVAAFATGGLANLTNPIGIRQHQNAQLQGMRLVQGPKPDYPLIDSFYMRGMGVGVRQRGAGAVMQVVFSPTYTVPNNFG